MSTSLQRMIDAFTAKDDATAMAMARALMHDSDASVRVQAKQILATCLFAAKHYEEASLLWSSMFDESNDSSDWVSAVTSLIYAKKLDEAERLYEPALKKL